MAKLLTDTMQQALDFAKAHDNKLTRHPGGVWSGKVHPDIVGIDCYNLDETYLRFRTTTIQGLISRGIAEYTDWKEGSNRRFPVEVTLTT